MGSSPQSGGAPGLDLVKKETATPKPCSDHTGSWSVNTWLKREEPTGLTKADVLGINWIGARPVHLMQNKALFFLSPGVDLYPKTLSLLCLLLHSSCFLESLPTVINLIMKTVYFCLTVLLSCKIPSSPESQDDCSECMESFYYEGKWAQGFTDYTYKPTACYSSGFPWTREGKHYWEGKLELTVCMA